MKNADREKIAWTPPPEVPDLPVIPILSPTPIGPEIAVCTSNRLVGVVTHWIGNRTRPCTGVTGACEGCMMGSPKRWKGYLPGEELQHGKKVLIEITFEAYRGCKRLHGVDPQLYGRKITLKRAGKARNSKVQVTVGETPLKDFAGEPFDVELALMRIWYGERLARGVKTAQEFKTVVQSLVHQVGELPAD